MSYSDFYRASGRTTKMLHKAIDALLNQNTNIVVVAFSDVYALDLQRKVVEVLHTYGCAKMFKIEKGKISTTKFFMLFKGSNQNSLTELRHRRNTKIFTDHFAGQSYGR